MIRRFLLLATLLLLSAASLEARPAWPALRTVRLADGSRLQCRLAGDEFSHYYITDAGQRLVPVSERDTLYRILSDDEVQTLDENARQRRSASVRRAPYASFPTIGEVRGLIILTEFKDVQFQPDYTQELYLRQMNESGFSDYNATGSARDYFISQSDSLFLPQFDVVGPVHLKYNESYYGNNSNGQDGNPAQMVKEACQMAHDSLNVDFSQYDFDDNGEVDFVFILYAGYGENYGAPSWTIWPHMSYLSGQYASITLDGKSVNRYACSCELDYSSGTQIDGIGAFCHEFGHVIGLPDFYNTNNSADSQLGAWDIMDSGSYNNDSRTPASYTAFERYSLGWMDLTDISTPADSLVLGEINTTHQAYRISTAKDNEFFTLENHQQQGWDLYEPGRGMMIIHVDYDASLWSGNGVNSAMHQHYDLEEADGTQGANRETDVYPISGNDMFTDYSSPSSLSWDDTPTEKGVTCIRQEDDGNISFRFMRDRLKRPVLLPATDISDSSFVANWEPVEGASYYQMSLHELLPDSLNPVLLDETFDAVPDDWTGNDLYAEEGGLIRIGSYGTSGLLTSPIITLPKDTTNLTLYFDARSYPGKSVSYTLTVSDASTGAPCLKLTLKASRALAKQFYTLSNCPASVKISFQTNKERLFLDDFRLVTGLRDTLEAMSLGPQEWTIDSIDAAFYHVKDLVPQRGYSYEVYAIDADAALRSSLPSATDTVYTLSPSSIRQVAKDSREASCAYDLLGRPVNPSTFKGMILLRKQ